MDCAAAGTLEEPAKQSLFYSAQGPSAVSLHRCSSGTFKEAVLAVHHVDPSPLQAGGAVDLAVVLVEPAVRATHRHEGGPAFLLADTLGAAGFCHQHTLSTPPTVSPPAGISVWVGEGWRSEREKRVYTGKG